MHGSWFRSGNRSRQGRMAAALLVLSCTPRLGSAAELRPYAPAPLQIYPQFFPQQQMMQQQIPPPGQEPLAGEQRAKAPGGVEPQVYRNFEEYARKQTPAKRKELLKTYSAKQLRALKDGKPQEAEYYRRLLEILRAIGN